MSGEQVADVLGETRAEEHHRIFEMHLYTILRLFYSCPKIHTSIVFVKNMSKFTHKYVEMYYFCALMLLNKK